MLCLIYKIENTINQKLYIGQTWQPLAVRWRHHKTHNECVKLHRAFKKYGESNFTISVILVVSSQECANYWEDYFIKYYNSIHNGYNIREGGSRGKMGPMSDETKAKISAALKNHPGNRAPWSEQRKQDRVALMKEKFQNGQLPQIEKFNHTGHVSVCRKLTMEQAREIRKWYADGVGVCKIAEQANCNRRTVRSILDNETYKDMGT